MAVHREKCTFVTVFLCLCIRLLETTNSSTSGGDDVLLPYAPGHGPSRSHRQVRDCQAVTHGNVTHESFPPIQHNGPPVAQSTVFVTDVPGSSRTVYGHMTVVQDPLRTFSVLAPGGPDGCKNNRRVSVAETARGAGCVYAQNAGFFNTQTAECLGNVVSDGSMLQHSGGVQNAQFGIRKDGSLVFGYLSQEDVSDQSNPFVQLVSGVIWLLRNGEIYINQSIEAECDKTQETGKLSYFINVLSGRTAVGHDEQGRLILFHIDGKTGSKGMSLWEVADFLKTNGVLNAINLDGGGSSTFVVNGSLSSYPSDECEPGKMWRCTRNVSTVLCVHPPRCHPANCSGNGDCVDGLCKCEEGWQGPTCDTLVCQPPACGPYGFCAASGCICDAGWTGKNCSQACSPGFYGDGCNQTCSCVNGGTCDPVHGSCSCPPGFHGDACEQVCPLGFFGLSCSKQCDCDHLCPCDPQTGKCNVTLQKETNSTLHRAGQCLATQMFTSWRREQEENTRQAFLTEQTWLIISVTLAALLSASLIAHVAVACRRSSPSSSHLTERQDYSYVPLTEINGPSMRSQGNSGTSRTIGFVSEDSDSQDEIWSP